MEKFPEGKITKWTVKNTTHKWPPVNDTNLGSIYISLQKCKIKLTRMPLTLILGENELNSTWEIFLSFIWVVPLAERSPQPPTRDKITFINKG